MSETTSREINMLDEFAASLWALLPEEMAHVNELIQNKQERIAENEVRYAEQFADDAELLVVAFGSAARIAATAIKHAREKGLKVGLFRPISLYPFPSTALAHRAFRARKVLVVELNAGQMLEDVKLAIGSNKMVDFFGRMGGVVPMPDEVQEAIEHAYVKPDEFHKNERLHSLN